MNRIAFYGVGNETTGSVGDRQPDTAKQDSAGSIGYTRHYLSEDINLPDSSPERDTVSFKSSEDDTTKKSSSVLGWVFGLAIATAAVVGGLGYAKKAGWIDKMGDGTFKKYVDKVASPCKDFCSKIKGWCKTGWDKVKNVFSSKENK